MLNPDVPFVLTVVASAGDELSQFWSAVLYGGTVSGLELSYRRRFDHLRTQPGASSPN